MARWVRFDWPTQFQGDPRGLGERADLIARRIEGNQWRLTTSEQYDGQGRPFIASGPIRSPEDAAELLDYANEWEQPPDIGQQSDPRIDAALKRLLHSDDTTETPSLEEYLEAARLLFMTSEAGQFQEWLVGGLAETLRDSLPASRMCLLTLATKVHARVAWARAVFATQHDQYAIGDGTAFQGFNAMRGLAGGGLQGSPAFLHPLLASHAPWTYGAATSRPPNGLMVVLLGAVVPGRQPLLHDDLLTSLTTNYLASADLIRAPATPEIEVENAQAALGWWVERLNHLLEVVLDPTLFSVDETYDPAGHLGFLVSLDRLFSSVSASLVYTGLDEYTRRIHLFEALDLLDGFGLGNYDTTLNPTRLDKYVGDLRTAIPDDAKPVFMHRLESAVSGLEELGEGFHAARVVDGMIDTPTEDEPELRMAITRATPRYLRTIRNAGHSLGEEIRKPRSLALLAAHNGEIPAAISDVAFVHLIRVLTDPDVVAKPLEARAT